MTTADPKRHETTTHRIQQQQQHISLIPPLPVNVRWLQWSREERGIICANHLVAAIYVSELESADNLSGDGLKLHIGKVLANATMSTGTEGKVRRRGALADETIAIIDLLFLFLVNLILIANHARGQRVILLPARGLPLVGLGEVLRVGCGDTGGGEEDVVGRDDILGAGDGHGRLDGAHDGVDRGVEAESLLDDGLVERELGEILVLEGGKILAKVVDLFLVESFHNIRSGGETAHDPGAGGRRRVLAGHQQGNHHVGDFVIGNLGAVLVGGVHEMLHHILLAIIATSATALHCVHVDLGDSSLGVITAVVPGEGSPVKHEVDGRKAHIQVVVEVGKLLVELVADLPALERVRGGEDGDLSHLGADVDNARLALEVGGTLEVAGNLVGDDGHIGAESFGGEGNLHELFFGVSANQSLAAGIVRLDQPSSAPSASHWGSRRQHPCRKQGW